jgi:hypothetical protein
MKALMVGGTSPTGPFIIHGLIERGYRVSMLHRGSHEIDEIPCPTGADAVRHVQDVIRLVVREVPLQNIHMPIDRLSQADRANEFLYQADAPARNRFDPGRHLVAQVAAAEHRLRHFFLPLRIESLRDSRLPILQHRLVPRRHLKPPPLHHTHNDDGATLALSDKGFQ